MKKYKYNTQDVKELSAPKFEILEEYVNSRTRILCKCNDCGLVFKGKTKFLFKQKGCPDCGKKIARETVKHHVTTEQFKTKLLAKKPNIEVLGEYKTQYIKIEVKCKNCNHEWSATPNNLLNKKGSNCYWCGHKSRVENFFLLSQEEFKYRIKELFGEKIQILSDYKGGDNLIEFYCLDCDKKYSKSAKLLSAGRGCLKCRRSKSCNEDLIENKLKTLGFKYEIQYSFPDLKSIKGKPLLYDFAILNNDNSIFSIIEFHGQQHYKSIEYFGGEKRFKQQQESDKKKEDYLELNSIPLLILNKESLKSFDWNNLYEKYKTNFNN